MRKNKNRGIRRKNTIRNEKNIVDLRGRGKKFMHTKRTGYIPSGLPRNKRASGDLDDKRQFNMLKCFHNGFLFTSKVLVFETKKGYHYQIAGEFTPEEKVLIRSILGDDIDRIKKDEDRINDFNYFGTEDDDVGDVDTLFHMKRRYGVWGYEDRINPLAEPFWNVRNR